MRIGLNLLPAVPDIGGSWTYTANLLGALAEYDHENEYVAFVTRAGEPLVPAAANFFTVEVPLHSQWRYLRVGFENTLLRGLLAGHRLDCVHHLFGTLPFAGALPSIVTIHDLMVYTRPQDFPVAKRTYLRFMRRRAARRAAALAPMSATTAKHLLALFDVAPGRSFVVPPAIGAHFHRASEAQAVAFRARLGLPPAFFLCVAEPYANKNHAGLLAAFAALRRAIPSGMPLALRGTPTLALRQGIDAAGLHEQVIFVPRLPDADMPLLYSAAAALIFPSVFEGGGIPVMEALACGCPVIASDLPTTREFAGDAAMLFDPLDASSITAAMQQVEVEPAVRQRLAAAAAATTPRSAQATAVAMMAAYRSAVQRDG